ncbi:2-isopropylmalate synthase [Metschnikowia bicuspidata]|uniref:2-isopropylmalate synthase n=1 Tax=Metschnikowia bicuspidata TaxID=27322 RepID=A0A4P9Z8S5_9ASCO|nr:2-isopropylmalate synthase [Metschnikowia bicuspidata]
MPMLKDPSVKYDAFPPMHLPNRQWPSKVLKEAPRWLSTDLRDGNQSLPDPMTFEEKKAYFHKLVDIGYKEIEVAFPSASQVDFDFTRYAVQNAPEDVTIQVLSQCREELIRRTVESLHGAHRATVHLYLATSECFRNVVFGLSQEKTKAIAVKCTQLVRALTKDDPLQLQTQWTYEFSPETFSDTNVDYVLEVCEAVKAAWEPSLDNPIIFNLPATVEMSTPNVYADQIEYFSTHISEREKVCISLHPHNDRGCAVAAAELGQLAGADRIEGCLFGNGERTGNVDLVTLGLNLYSQGISPKIDFSNLNEIIEIVERCNKIRVSERAPYGGSLVVCAFSGSHQDAIKKGFSDYSRQLAESDNKNIKWKLPYLPIDPTDIGRTYEMIIRINSQSGKGGSAWVILKNIGLDLPRALQVDFLKAVQNQAEVKGLELTNAEICALFRKNYYMDASATYPYQIIYYSITSAKAGKREITIELQINGETRKLGGSGNGPISAFSNAILSDLGIQIDVKHYHEHSLGEDSNSQAVTYIGAVTSHGEIVWGVGIHEDVSQASFLSLVSILNNLHARQASSQD